MHVLFIWLIKQLHPLFLSVRVKCFCPQIYKRRFPSCPDFHLVGVFRFAVSSFFENNSMIPYGAKKIAFICIDVVRVEFLNIDNMNTEGNKAKHLKIERETSANFPNQFGLSIDAFECSIRLGNICKRIESLQQFKNFAFLNQKSDSLSYWIILILPMCREHNE